MIVKKQRMLKVHKNVKGVCFHVIPHKNSPVKYFSDHNHIFRKMSNVLSNIKLNGLNRQNKISFDAMSSPNINPSCLAHL